MSTIKEITVFSVGDANDLSTWSNVPYFFTKTLEQKGFRVNRINIEENKLLFNIYKYTVFTFLKLVYRNSYHTYFRSKLNYHLTKKKIAKALKENPDTDIAIFMTFSFTAPPSFKQKVVLFGDWTYLYYIQEFNKHFPYWFEKDALRREKRHIESANSVIGLFPLSSAFIKQNYNCKNVHYLGNVINCNYELNNEIVRTKIDSKKILFIGNRKYLAGALELITAFKNLKSKFTNIELHFIGLTKEDLKVNDAEIFCYGYLNKSNLLENKLYYELLSQARVIVNTTKDWGGFSATIEAMYFYTPVITRAYPEFTETFGKDIDFGNYVNESNNLNTCIERVLQKNENEQAQFAKAAHEKVKDFTWNNYIDKMLMEGKLI